MRHAKLIRVGIVLTECVVLLVPVLADEKGDRAEAEESIKQVRKAWQDSWNKHDAAALAELVIEDVDWVRAIGPEGWLKGRKQFQEFHAKIHQGYFKDSVWTTKATHIRLLRSDVAVAQVLWSIMGDSIPDPSRKPGQPRDGIFTWVLEKRAGKWLVVASQNTEAPPPGSPRPLDEDKKAKPDK